MSAELPDDERPGTNSSVSCEQQNVEISCIFFFSSKFARWVCLVKWNSQECSSENRNLTPKREKSGRDTSFIGPLSHIREPPFLSSLPFPSPRKKNLLTNFVRFRFGTHVSGAPSVQRSLRINNTGPYGELMENCYRAYAHDATAAILVFQNNETAAMLVCKTNPVRVELFSCVNTFFVPRHLHDCWTSEFIRFIGLVDM